MKNEMNNMQLYNDILDKLLVISSNLDKYNDLSNKILLAISQEYSVNEQNPVIHDRIRLLSKKVNNISNYLKSTIIPSVKVVSLEHEKENM